MIMAASAGLGLLGARYFPPLYEARATLAWRPTPEQFRAGQAERRSYLLEQAARLMSRAYKNGLSASPGGPGPWELLDSPGRSPLVSFRPQPGPNEERLPFVLAFRHNDPEGARAGLALWLKVLVPEAAGAERADPERWRLKLAEAQEALAAWRALLEVYRVWNAGRLPEHQFLNQRMIQELRAEAEALDRRLAEAAAAGNTKPVGAGAVFQTGRPLAALGGVALGLASESGGPEKELLWRLARNAAQKAAAERKIDEYRRLLKAAETVAPFYQSLAQGAKRAEAYLSWNQRRLNQALSARNPGPEPDLIRAAGPGEPELLKVDLNPGWRLAAGLALGGLASLGFLVFSELASERVYRARTVAALTGWPVIGVFPMLKGPENAVAENQPYPDSSG